MVTPLIVASVFADIFSEKHNMLDVEINLCWVNKNLLSLYDD